MLSRFFSPKKAFSVEIDLFSALHQPTGIGNYIIHLLEAMMTEYEVDFEYPLSAESKDLGESLKARFSAENRGNLKFRSKEERPKPELVHLTNSVAGLELEHRPYVMTAHDIAWMKVAENQCPKPPFAALAELPDLLRGASRILAVSHSTKRDLIEVLGISSERIRVTPLAARSCFFPPSLEEREAARRKFGEETPYFLFLGTVEPRKNLPALLEALSKLHRQGIKRNLIVIGTPAWGMKAVKEKISALNLESSVQLLGFVTNSLLREYLWGAEALVLPSFYEGFGLPVLEAMASGTCVISSDQGSLREVGGDAALFIDPYSVDSIAEALSLIALERVDKVKMRKLGFKNAKRYSWKKTARVTFRAYQDALGINGSFPRLRSAPERFQPSTGS